VTTETAPKPVSKSHQRAEEQRHIERRAGLEQALRERETRVRAAYRAHC
jgi:hypothetical protein